MIDFKAWLRKMFLRTAKPTRRLRRKQRTARPTVETLEDRVVPAFFVPGTIQGQDGWTGGTIAIAPTVAQGVDQSGPANTHLGVGSWLVSNNTSLGNHNGAFGGWPFGPGLAVSAGQPSSGAPADRFRATFFFKAASGVADGSNIEVDLGTTSGTDRNTFMALTNKADGDGGFQIRMAESNLLAGAGNDYFYDTQIVFTDIDRTVWHRIDIQATFVNGTSNDTFQVSLDGGAPFTNTSPGSPNNGTANWGTFEGYRDGHGFTYELSNRMYFRSGAAPSAYGAFIDTDAAGFYFDDVSYQDWNSAAPATILASYGATFEPASAAPSTVFVNASWAGIPFGIDPDGVGPATAIGYNAFATIQLGVNGVSSSGTVNVADGTYFESNISVTKAVTIIGQSRAGVIVGPSIDDAHVDDRFTSASNGFVIRSSDVAIQTMTIDGNANTGLSGTENFRNAVVADLNLGSFNNTKLDDLSIQNIYRRGIDLRTSGTHTTGNEITNSSFDSVGLGVVATSGGYAIAIFESDTLITDNIITNSGAGVGTNYVVSAANAPLVTIKRNTISGVTEGLGLSGLAAGSVIGGSVADANTISGSGPGSIGIILQYATGLVTIDHNDISGFQDGIYLYNLDQGGAPSHIVSNNTIHTPATVAGSRGIHLSSSAPFDGDSGLVHATLSGNTITGYETGISMVQGSQSVAVSFGLGNSVIGGTTGLLVNGANATIVGATLSNLAFSAQTGNYITLTNAAMDNVEIDGTAAKFGGLTGSTASNAQNFAIEDKITHAVDNASLGFVRVKAGNVFVTQNSGLIQRGVDTASAGNIVNVAAGTYAENLLVNKSVILHGANTGIDPNTGMRGAETIVLPGVTETSVQGSTSGTIVRVGSGSGHVNVTIDGFTFDGHNASLTGGRTLNGVEVNTGAAIVNSVGSFDANPGAYDTTMIVQNNIIQNLERYGVLADNVAARPGVTGNDVSHNKIDNLPSGNNFGGGRGRGVAFEENVYGTVSFNVMTRVNVGWQDDNYNIASPGAGTVVDHNIIHTYHRGIFHNLQYQSATAATISNNKIFVETTGDFPASTTNFGIELASISNTVGATVTDNDVTGTVYGLLLWNLPTTGVITVSGGTLTNNAVGIFATNNDPQFGAVSASTSAVISGVSVVHAINQGILVQDDPAVGATGTVSLTVKDDTSVSGSATGILILGANASAAIQNNDNSIHGNAIGIDVDTGFANINNNHIYDNATGIRLTNGGTATITNNNFEGAANPDNGTDLRLDATAGAITGGAVTGNTFAGTTFYIDNQDSQNINATTSTFKTANAIEADNFAIENRIEHKIDNAASGLVTWVANNIYVTPATSPTATDNDYTRLANAVAAASNGSVINLQGTFDWTETNANASWVLGNDGISQGGGGDDYTLAIPAGLNGVTFTAPGGPGTATIHGPGDVPTIDLEGVFYFTGTGLNQNWTISNLVIDDFDMGIGMFFGAGGSHAYDGTHIFNNHIIVASDVATAGDTGQNIGIHYSFGTNQVIQGNTIDLRADSVSVGLNLAANVGMQSNTSGGDVYNGLLIDGNIINVLGTQASPAPVILGIWENGHAHSSNITVSNNHFFSNDPSNNPATNLERAFRVTSHSSTSTTVTYSGNTVDGANIGFQWFAGGDFTLNQAVRLWGNTITDTNTGVLIQSNGVANLYRNTITNSGAGGGVQLIDGGRLAASGTVTHAVQENIISGGSGDGIVIGALAGTIGAIFNNDLSNNAGRGINNAAPAVVDASGNWWGSDTPGLVAAEVSTRVDYSPWLNLATQDPATGSNPGFQGDFSSLHVDDDSPQVGATGRIAESVGLLANGSLTGGNRVINIANGTYQEANISLNKALTIQGETQTGVIVAPATVDNHTDDRFAGITNNAFVVRSSNVTIETLTVDGDAGIGGAGSHNFRNAVVADNSLGNFNNTVIDHITARNIARRGVDLRVLNAHTSGHQVTNSQFDNVGNDLSGTGAAIAIFGGDALISANQITSSAAGIFANAVFPAVPVLTIRGNNISATPVGMNLAALGAGSFIGGPNVGDGNTINTVGGGSTDVALLVTFGQGDITIQNNAITVSQGDAGIQLFRDEIAPVHILGNQIISSGSTFTTPGTGTAIFLTDNPAPFGEGNTGGDLADIRGNTITNFFYGIDIERVGTNPPYSNGPRHITVNIGGPNAADNNVITGNGSGTGIRVKNDIGSAAATFASATIQNNSASISGFAIGIDVDGGSAAILNNHIYGNTIGVNVTNAGAARLNGNVIDLNVTGILVTGVGGGVLVNGNNLAGNTGFALNNQSATRVDAGGNYWGSATPAGVAAEISGSALFAPWLSSGLDQSPNPGFQPNYLTLVAVTDEDTVLELSKLGTVVIPPTSPTTGGATITGVNSFNYNPIAAFNSLPQGGSATDSYAYTFTDANSQSQAPLVTITIAGHNDAPVLNNSVTMALDSIDANDASNNGNTIEQILFTGAGGNPITDVDTGAVEGIAVISASVVGSGTWQYSINNGSVWTNFPIGINFGNALLLAADGATRIRFVPDLVNSGVPTLNFVAWDRTDAGSNGGTKNLTLSGTGGTTAYSTAVGSATINVTPANNDAPVNTAPTDTLVINEDQPLFFTGANQISVLDPDAGSADIQVTLTAMNGTLTITNVFSGVYLIGDGTADATMRLVGSQSAINAALATLRFDPTPSFNGLATVLVATNDLGNTGVGGPKTDVDTINIAVLAVADAPVANDDSAPTPEDLGVTVPVLANDTDPDNLSGPANAGLTVIMIDGAFATVGTPITVANGNGTATLNTGGTITFTPTANYNGVFTTFTYTISDDGSSAPAHTATATVTITVNAVNDTPTADNGSAIVNEDGSVVIDLTALVSDVETADADLVYNVGPVAHGSLVPVIGQNGHFTYTPTGNYNGPDSFTFSVTDTGDPAPSGNVLTSLTRSVSINVASVNDAPVAVADSYTVNEDSTLGVLAANGVLFNDADPNDTPANGLSATLISNVTHGTLFFSTDGSFTYTPNANFNGTGANGDHFTYQVKDDGGTLNGGVNVGNTVTVTINVTSINDAPAGTDNTVTTSEDTPYVFHVADFGLTDPLDSPANSFNRVMITTTPTSGSLTLNGIPVMATSFVTKAQLDNNELVFTPAAQASGTPYASFTFQVEDNGGGANLDLSANTMTINVASANDAPAGTDNTVTTSEDTPYVFHVADFGFTDPLDSPANTFNRVMITTTPTSGSLTLNGIPVIATNFVTKAQLDNNELVFTPAAQASGTPYASFTFQVEDNGGGTNLDLSANTITINVGASNDPPVNSVPGPQTTATNAALVFSGGAQISVADLDAGLNFIQVTLSVAHGALTLSSIAGLTFGFGDTNGAGQGDGVSDATMTFRGSVASVNAALNGLTYQPTANYVGSDALSITTNDLGNTGAGGVQTDIDSVNINVAPTFQDNFNRANAPTLGANWTTQLGSVNISSNTALTSPTNVSLATVNALSLTDVVLQADVTIPNVNGARAGLMARYSGPAESNFYLGMVYNNNGVYEAYIFLKTGSYTLLTMQTLPTFNGAVPNNLRFEVVGKVLKFFVNDVLRAVAYDSTIAAAGFVGVRGVNASLDNFSASSVVVLPASTSYTDHFANPQNGADLDRVWTEQFGAFTIQNQKAVADPVAGVSIATLNSAATADSIAQVDVNLTTAGSHAGLVARYSGPAQKNFYVGLVYNNAGTYQAYIFVNLNGVFTQLTVQSLPGFSGAGTVRFEVVGNQLKLFVNNVLRAFAYDSSIATPGLVGVRAMNASLDEFTASAVTPQSQTLGFTDTFTKPNNSDLDRVWKERIGAFTTQTNRAADAAGLAPVSLATLNGVSAANVVVQAQVSLNASGSGAGLVARYSGPDQSNFYLGMVYNDNGVYKAYIFLNQGGNFVQLDVQTLPAFTGTGLLRFEVSGASLKLFVDNVQKASATNSVLTAAGLVGIRSANASLDDFNVN